MLEYETQNNYYSMTILFRAWITPSVYRSRSAMSDHIVGKLSRPEKKGERSKNGEAWS